MEIFNALTIDLEDWYQGLTSTNPQVSRWHEFEDRVIDNSDRLLKLLERLGVKATFFVLGYVAQLHPDLIRRIDAAGHEIGIHGFYHRRVSGLGPMRFSAELESAIDIVGELTTQAIIGHRAPYFSINGQSLWALDVLRQKGFIYDSSFFPTRNPLYGYPRACRFPHWAEGENGLIEFPISTARWAGVNWPIGGGFYVRSLPYWIIRQGIRQLNNQGQPAILYFHPWEFDTNQHFCRVTPREKVTHYFGRRNLWQKLVRLLADFKFAPLRELIKEPTIVKSHSNSQ